MMRGLALALCLTMVTLPALAQDPFESAPAPARDPFHSAPPAPAAPKRVQTPRYVPRPEPPPPAPVDPDMTMWTTVAGSSNPADFDAYLRLFPYGRFADDARARLTALRALLPAGTIVVKSGVFTPLVSHQCHDKRCAPRPLPLDIIEQPQHGTVAVREEAVKVPEKQQVGNSCTGELVNGKRIYYQSQAGFQGNDRITYQYTGCDRVFHRDTINIIVR